MTNARREYEEALAAYYAAQERLTEAKRHYDPKTAPEFIAKRKAYMAARSARQKAKNAEWLASSECAAQDEHFRLFVERYNRRGIAT